MPCDKRVRTSLGAKWLGCPSVRRGRTSPSPRPLALAGRAGSPWKSTAGKPPYPGKPCRNESIKHCSSAEERGPVVLVELLTTCVYSTIFKLTPRGHDQRFHSIPTAKHTRGTNPVRYSMIVLVRELHVLKIQEYSLRIAKP